MYHRDISAIDSGTILVSCLKKLVSQVRALLYVEIGPLISSILRFTFYMIDFMIGWSSDIVNFVPNLAWSAIAILLQEKLSMVNGVNTPNAQNHVKLALNHGVDNALFLNPCKVQIVQSWVLMFRQLHATPSHAQVCFLSISSRYTSLL